MITQTDLEGFPSKPLGMYLLEAELITPLQLEMALNEQKHSGRQLGEILVGQGLVKQQTLEYLIKKVVLPERAKLKKKPPHPDKKSSQNLALVKPANSTEAEYAIANTTSEQLEVSFFAKKTFKFLVWAIVCLTVASLYGNFSYYNLPDYPTRDGFRSFFNFNGEVNIPSIYSTLTLLFCSFLLAIIARARKLTSKKDYLSWRGLTIVFAYLSFDELTSVHERLVDPLRNKFNTSGLLYYAWVIAGAIFVVVFLLVFWRFIANLPAKTRRLFMITGIIYVSGALGIEMIGGYYADYYQHNNIIYAFITTIEEVLEMLGVAVFIYGLLSYISGYMKGLDLAIHIGDRHKHHPSA